MHRSQDKRGKKIPSFNPNRIEAQEEEESVSQSVVIGGLAWAGCGRVSMGRSRDSPPETRWVQSDVGDYGHDVDQGVFGE
jgi:hypothetical protein